MTRLRWTAFVLLACAACSGDDGGESAPPSSDEADLSPLGGDRPVEPLVPADFDRAVATPLVILLHGRTATGKLNDALLGVGNMVDKRGFIYLRPDGTLDSNGDTFWNATDACCDVDDSGVDDLAYINSLIDEARQRYNISRVAVFGHSNGGFMSNRIACDSAESIAAFASIAGSTFDDPTRCQPAEAVAALHIHGTLDDGVPYEGNTDPARPWPGAVETTARWAALSGCDATATSEPSRDYTIAVDGNETQVIRHSGCNDGGAAELWTLEEVGHVPLFNEQWRNDLLDFLIGGG